MRVAGFGFRAGASLASLQDALLRALDACPLGELASLQDGLQRGLDACPLGEPGAHDLAALATAEDKTGAACIQALAARLGLAVRAVSPEEIASMTTLTNSARVRAARGTGSVAEAAALAAARQLVRGEPALLHARAVSADRQATCAIARLPCVRGLRS